MFLEALIPRRYKITSKTVFALVSLTNAEIHGAAVIGVVLGLNFALIATVLHKTCHGFLPSFRAVVETPR